MDTRGADHDHDDRSKRVKRSAHVKLKSKMKKKKQEKGATKWLRSDIINIGTMFMRVNPLLVKMYKHSALLRKNGLWDQGVIGCMLNHSQRSRYIDNIGCTGIPDNSKNIKWSFLPTKAGALCRPTDSENWLLEYVPKTVDYGGIKKISVVA